MQFHSVTKSSKHNNMLKSVLPLLLLLSIVTQIHCADNSSGFSQVWRVSTSDAESASILERLEDDDLVRHVREGGVVAIKRDYADIVSERLEQAGAEWHVLVDDYPALVKEEIEAIRRRREQFEGDGSRQGEVDFDLDNYHTLEEIMNYIQDLAGN